VKATTGKLAALLVVTALTLSGCSLVGEVGQVGGSIAEETALDAELSALRGTIVELDGVTDVTATVEIEGDYEFFVEFAVTADGLTESVADEIVVAAGDAFSAGTLGKQDVFFTLTTEDDGALSFTSLALSGVDLSGEVEYWFAFQEAYGSPLRLSLYGDESVAGEAPYLSHIETYSPGAVPDWDALRAVSDGTEAARSWRLYGVDVVGSLPPEPVTEVIDDLTRRAGEYIGLQWDGTTEVFIVAVYSPDLAVGMPLVDSPAWPSVRDAAALLAAAPARASTLSYYGDDPKTAVAVHLGDCSGEMTAGPLDAGFGSALSATGVLVEVQASPGRCLAN